MADIDEFAQKCEAAMMGFLHFIVDEGLLNVEKMREPAELVVPWTEVEPRGPGASQSGKSPWASVSSAPQQPQHPQRLQQAFATPAPTPFYF